MNDLRKIYNFEYAEKQFSVWVTGSNYEGLRPVMEEWIKKDGDRLYKKMAELEAEGSPHPFSGIPGIPFSLDEIFARFQRVARWPYNEDPINFLSYPSNLAILSLNLNIEVDVDECAAQKREQLALLHDLLSRLQRCTDG